MVATNRVEVVLINHRRPDNVRRIVDALRNQTEDCSIALIDDPPDRSFALDDHTLGNVDSIFRFSTNYGPFSRYIPLAAYSHEFTYFHDDDMLPGRRLIEHLLVSADRAPAFGVLGERGRRLDEDGIYRGTTVKRTDQFEPVDAVVRGFFVRTSNLSAVVEQRSRLAQPPAPELEDDLVLCTAMSMQKGLTSFLIPQNPDRETSMCKEELPAPFARQHRDHHKTDRSAFCRIAIDAGWKPVFMIQKESCKT